MPKSKPNRERRTKAARARERHFSGARFFSVTEKHFVPLPWTYRVVLHALTPREWVTLSWLMMYAPREGVFRLDKKALMHETDFSSHSKMAGVLKSLEAKGFVRFAQDGPVEWVAVLHPVVAIEQLHKQKKLSTERMRDVQDFFEDKLQKTFQPRGET